MNPHVAGGAILVARVGQVMHLVRSRDAAQRAALAQSGVALGADDSVIGVIATKDIGARNGLRVAAQVGIQDLFGRRERERHRDGIPASTFAYVVLSRGVAALAPGIFGLLLARCDALEM